MVEPHCYYYICSPLTVSAAKVIQTSCAAHLVDFLSIFNDVLSLFGKQRPAVRKVSPFNYSSKTVIMLILISWPSLKKL